MLQIHLYENGKPLRESSFPEFPANSYQTDSPEALIAMLRNLLSNHNSGIGKILIENDEFGWSCSVTNAQSVQTLDEPEMSQFTVFPTEEQLEDLWIVTEKYLESDYAPTRDVLGKTLSNLYDTLKNIRTKSKSFDIDSELNAWRHIHFHGDRDFSASGEYMKRETQRSLAEYFLTLGMTLAQSK